MWRCLIVYHPYNTIQHNLTPSDNVIGKAGHVQLSLNTIQLCWRDSPTKSSYFERVVLFMGFPTCS